MAGSLHGTALVTMLWAGNRERLLPVAETRVLKTRLYDVNSQDSDTAFLSPCSVIKEGALTKLNCKVELGRNEIRNKLLRHKSLTIYKKFV